MLRMNQNTPNLPTLQDLHGKFDQEEQERVARDQRIAAKLRRLAELDAEIARLAKAIVELQAA
jgi:uncharacterized protein (DUF3084 family)